MNDPKQQDRTKERFEALFALNRSYYEKQTKQDENREELLAHLHIAPKDTIVDLGTGTGYLAFPIATRYPDTKVYGLDIVENTLLTNQAVAKDQGLTNLTFWPTNGTLLPFLDQSVSLLVTRFALHHFVAIKESFQEFFRILKPGGQLFLCDPTPVKEDVHKIIDQFMQLVPDGHVTFYTEKELDSLAQHAGFTKEDSYYTEVYFPSETRTKGYMGLTSAIPDSLKKAYAFEIKEGEVWAREPVINLSYRKPKN